MASVEPLSIDLPDQLEGERVIVRPWAERDSADLWDAIDNSREHLEAWMPWVDRYRNPDNALEYCRRSLARWLLREDLAGRHRRGRRPGGSSAAAASTASTGSTGCSRSATGCGRMPWDKATHRRRSSC